MHVVDDDVDVAVVVDVPERGAAADGGLTEDRLPWALTFSNRPFPRLRSSRFRSSLEFLVELRRLRLNRSVRRKQIEPPVVVEVEPGGAETGGPLGDWSEPDVLSDPNSPTRH